MISATEKEQKKISFNTKKSKWGCYACMAEVDWTAWLNSGSWLDGVVECWKLIGLRDWMLEADWTTWLNAGSWLASKDLPLTTVGTEERDVRGDEAALLLLQYSESVSSQLLIRLPFSIHRWSPNKLDHRNCLHLGTGVKQIFKKKMI
jgi:hypothetical protein